MGEVTMVDPVGKELWRQTAPSGKLLVDDSRSGEHTLCFKSTSDDVQTVSFDARVGAPEDFLDDTHREFVTQNHTDQMKEVVDQLYNRVLTSRSSSSSRSPE